MVGASRKTRDGRGGEQDELMCCEELVHTGAEVLVALAEGGNFGGGETRAPFEPIADGGFELIEVAGVEAGSFRGLDGSQDREGVGPP
jgi:hypothetical protein